MFNTENFWKCKYCKEEFQTGKCKTETMAFFKQEFVMYKHIIKCHKDIKFSRPKYIKSLIKRYISIYKD